MDFRVLRYFITVAEELNFTRAAEKLNMSQPPLSSQIKGLEELLGVQLFVRGKRRLELTEAGRVLLRRANEIMALGEKTRDELTALTHELSGAVAVGLVEGRSPWLALPWVRKFGELYPLVRWDFWNGSSDDIIDRLFRGLLDVGIITAPYDEEHLDGFVVAKEPWIALIPESNPLSKEPGAEITLKSLAKNKLFIPARKSRYSAILKWFGDIGENPEIAGTVTSYATACAIVEANVGICIFPQSSYTPNPHVVAKVIIDPSKFAEYVLVWDKSAKLAKPAAEFVRLVKKLIEEEGIDTEPDALQSAIHIMEDADLL